MAELRAADGEVACAEGGAVAMAGTLHDTVEAAGLDAAATGLVTTNVGKLPVYGNYPVMTRRRGPRLAGCGTW